MPKLAPERNFLHWAKVGVCLFDITSDEKGIDLPKSIALIAQVCQSPKVETCLVQDDGTFHEAVHGHLDHHDRDLVEDPGCAAKDGRRNGLTLHVDLW